MHLFFSVGEPSGDQHAAHLIEELRRRQPGLRISGFGGPLMEEAGVGLLYRLTDLAVMGIFRVLPMLWTFYKLIRKAGQFLREERPDAVILIDFPGFNWWVARKAKAAGIPVFYYLPPQLWAWAPWRIGKMRRLVDHVLCGLSFEPEWYARRGMQVDFVGHPFFDEVADRRLDAAFLATQRSLPAPLVGILPGSRNHEVHKHWPIQLEAMRRVRRQVSSARFVVANYRESHREYCRTELERWQAQHPEEGPLPVEFHVGLTPEIIEASDCCLMVSGSVSLEMLARRKPAVVIYKSSRIAYPFLRLLINVRMVSLPNLMAGRKLLPEILVCHDWNAELEEMSSTLSRWLTSSAELQAAKSELDALANEVARTGATRRAAEAILLRMPAAARVETRRAA